MAAIGSSVAKAARARAALRDAVLAMERSRGPLRRSHPARAVGEWRVLVEGRWSLLDRFESDGKRFIVAVANDPIAPGPDALTERERQVTAAAAAGRHNKLIAYELGVSASTVRVLLSRAARKLSVNSRRELVALYRAFQKPRGAYEHA